MQGWVQSRRVCTRVLYDKKTNNPANNKLRPVLAFSGAAALLNKRLANMHCKPLAQLP